MQLTSEEISTAFAQMPKREDCFEQMVILIIACCKTVVSNRLWQLSQKLFSNKSAGNYDVKTTIAEWVEMTSLLNTLKLLKTNENCYYVLIYKSGVSFNLVAKDFPLVKKTTNIFAKLPNEMTLKLKKNEKYRMF